MMTTTQNKTEDFNVCFSFLLNLKCIALSFFNFAFISFYVSIFFYYYILFYCMTMLLCEALWVCPVYEKCYINKFALL